MAWSGSRGTRVWESMDLLLTGTECRRWASRAMRSSHNPSAAESVSISPRMRATRSLRRAADPKPSTRTARTAAGPTLAARTSERSGALPRRVDFRSCSPIAIARRFLGDRNRGRHLRRQIVQHRADGKRFDRHGVHTQDIGSNGRGHRDGAIGGRRRYGSPRSGVRGVNRPQEYVSRFPDARRRHARSLRRLEDTAGFVVRESQGGRSTVEFDYRIVATALGESGRRMSLISTGVAAGPRAPEPLVSKPRAPQPMSLPPIPR